jgi:hypothetical protein
MTASANNSTTLLIVTYKDVDYACHAVNVSGGLERHLADVILQSHREHPKYNNPDIPRQTVIVLTSNQEIPRLLLRSDVVLVRHFCIV